MRRETLDFRMFWLTSHIARFLCINVLEPNENLTGPTWVNKERIFSFRSFQTFSEMMKKLRKHRRLFAPCTNRRQGPATALNPFSNKFCAEAAINLIAKLKSLYTFMVNLWNFHPSISSHFCKISRWFHSCCVCKKARRHKPMTEKLGCGNMDRGNSFTWDGGNLPFPFI